MPGTEPGTLNSVAGHANDGSKSTDSPIVVVLLLTVTSESSSDHGEESTDSPIVVVLLLTVTSESSSDHEMGRHQLKRQYRLIWLTGDRDVRIRTSDRCPSCRRSLSTTSRNVALEQIAEQCLHPSQGIGVELRPPKQHRVYDCLSGKPSMFQDLGCQWQGKRSELWRHVKETHGPLAMHLERSKLCFRLTNHNFTINAKTVILFYAMNELFWYHFHQDCKSQKCNAALLG
uniref:Uncharacterized protein n=1 Tax=Timema tahoe TaxID=61484 RepID=A0A7R9ISH0_9NEOP|nr:unnamed protein product [Timema tahoe]